MNICNFVHFLNVFFVLFPFKIQKEMREEQKMIVNTNEQLENQEKAIDLK